MREAFNIFGQPLNNMLTIEEGIAAVELARRALTSYVTAGSRIGLQGLQPVFQERRGVFVTLHKGGALRGCIGYPQPVLPLGQALIDSAIQAGCRDPRFPPVAQKELSSIEIEVTVLTEPEIVHADRRSMPDAIEIGRHGLIVTRGMHSGLLLPQVATEWGFDSLDFLCQTCIKAGLPPDSWIETDTEVCSFEAQIFSEQGPAGTVVEKTLQKCGCGRE